MYITVPGWTGSGGDYKVLIFKMEILETRAARSQFTCDAASSEMTGCDEREKVH